MSVLDFMSLGDLMDYRGEEREEEEMKMYLIEEPREGGGNRFWTGKKWSESALEGMRFYTEESARAYIQKDRDRRIGFTDNLLVCEHIFH